MSNWGPSHPSQLHQVTSRVQSCPYPLKSPLQQAAGLKSSWGPIQPELPCYDSSIPSQVQDFAIILCWICAFGPMAQSPRARCLIPAPPSWVLNANLLRADSTMSSGKMLNLTGPRTDPWTLLLQHPELDGLYPINHCCLILTAQSIFYPSSCLSV